MGGAAGLLLVASIAPGAAAESHDAGAANAESRAACMNGWAADVAGPPPGFHFGAPTGLYLWHTQKKGWRLRVTHPNPPGTRTRMLFEGRLTSGAPMWTSERRIEGSDALVKGKSHLTTFRFANFGGIDGINFRLGCGEGFLVDASVDGRRLRPDQVFIGADRHHPPHVPFRITRVGN